MARSSWSHHLSWIGNFEHIAVSQTLKPLTPDQSCKGLLYQQFHKGQLFQESSLTQYHIADGQVRCLTEVFKTSKAIIVETVPKALVLSKFLLLTRTMKCHKGDCERLYMTLVTPTETFVFLSITELKSLNYKIRGSQAPIGQSYHLLSNFLWSREQVSSSQDNL